MSSVSCGSSRMNQLVVLPKKSVRSKRRERLRVRPSRRPRRACWRAVSRGTRCAIRREYATSDAIRVRRAMADRVRRHARNRRRCCEVGVAERVGRCACIASSTSSSSAMSAVRSRSRVHLARARRRRPTRCARCTLSASARARPRCCDFGDHRQFRRMAHDRFDLKRRPRADCSHRATSRSIAGAG